MTPIFELPVGGTTSLSHVHSANVDEAGRFLATTPPKDRPRPLVPSLRAMFGLSAIEVCEAIRQAQRIRASAL